MRPVGKELAWERGGAEAQVGSRLSPSRTAGRPGRLAEWQGSAGLMKYPRLVDGLGVKLAVLEPSSKQAAFLP